MSEKQVKTVEGESELKPQVKLPKPKPELSAEAIQERAFLTGLFVQQADELAKEASERKRKREEELIELCSGEKISIAQVKSIITAIRQAYEAVFTNESGYYKEVYRLNKWDHLDSKEYIKPAIVGTWTIELYYNRMGKDVFPALSALNPAFPNGIRMHKCFQFLTDEGREKLIGFRNETVKLMRKCTTWYEFRKLLFKECGVPYQESLFEGKL